MDEATGAVKVIKVWAAHDVGRAINPAGVRGQIVGGVAQGIGFALVFPLSFLAGTFVPIEGMKTIPRAIGEWDPISAFVAAIRQVTQGTESHGSWQLEHPVPAMIAWCLVIIAVCVPLALRRFRTTTAG